MWEAVGNRASVWPKCPLTVAFHTISVVFNISSCIWINQKSSLQRGVHVSENHSLSKPLWLPPYGWLREHWSGGSGVRRAPLHHSALVSPLCRAREGPVVHRLPGSACRGPASRADALVCSENAMNFFPKMGCGKYWLFWWVIEFLWSFSWRYSNSMVFLQISHGFKYFSIRNDFCKAVCVFMRLVIINVLYFRIKTGLVYVLNINNWHNSQLVFLCVNMCR